MRTPNLLLKRIAAVEKQVNEMASLMANHVASMPVLLVGWAEIAAYCRKKPRTLSRYAKGLSFPACRWGRHVVSSPYAIDGWLLAFKAARAAARKRFNPVATLTDEQLKGRLNELDANLKR